jgi:Mg2+ and Co2+ transporter CorA
MLGTQVAGAEEHGIDQTQGLPWQYGYALSVLLLIVVSAAIYLVFRRRGWLT